MARPQLLGEVNLLGLNQYGQNPGMNPIFGMAIGGGTSAVTSLILRRTGSKHAEGFGLLTGLAISGAMFAMKSTRHAAIASAIGAFFASGVAWLEKTLLGTATIAVPGTAGIGVPNIRALNGLGVPSVRALNGLGVPSISPTVPPVGAIPGVAGNQLAAPGLSAPPVSLLGQTSPQAAHLRNIGGPMAHGLSASYGATLLGGGR